MSSIGARVRTVGLVADPELPIDLARYMADGLVERLERRVDDGVRWRVETVEHAFVVGPDEVNDVIAARGLARLRRRPVGEQRSAARRGPRAGVAGGALGSGFESDQAVRQATYGRRERVRRQAAAEQADQTAA